jgi:AraC-like DNA-binding protein
MASPTEHLDPGKPRGVLNRSADESRFSYWRRLPSTELNAFIEHYWSISWDLRGQEPFTQQTVPHPAVHLVLERRNSRIFGVIKKRFSRVLEGQGRVFGVKFKPGAFYPFLKSPVSGLTDSTVAPSEVFGPSARDLEEGVLALQDEFDMVAAAEQFLLCRLPDRDETAILAGRLVEQVRLDREITNVSQVVDRFNIGKRMLQRMFDHYIGVSPKWVIRVYRLHEIIERLGAGETIDLAGLSQDLGYFDQAHFIRDFKSVVGRTPAEHLRSLRPPA